MWQDVFMFFFIKVRHLIMGTRFVPSALQNVRLPTSIQEGDAIQFSQIDGPRLNETPLFIRPHLTEKLDLLNAFLSNDSLLQLYISGPPGCGKTSFVTLWAHLFARTGKRVLLVNFRTRQECVILQLEGASVDTLSRAPTSDALRGALETFLDSYKTAKFDLCVFDGVREQERNCANVVALLNSFTGEATERKIAKVVHVTSLSFRMRGGDANLGFNSYIGRESFDSWVLEDHVDAFKSLAAKKLLGPMLLADIKRHMDSIAEDEDDTEDSVMDREPSDADLEEYANYKYFFAGGSARFMFTHSIATLKEELDTKIRLVNDWKVFTSNNLPDAAPFAVNTLMQRFSTNQEQPYCIAVSRYVLTYAYAKCAGELVEAVSRVANATGNPALKGWAFELKQLELIKNILASRNSLPKHAKTEQGLAFSPYSQTSYDGKILEAVDSLENGSLIWCLKWNQGCFDLAFYSNSTLVTLQFIVSKDHSLKLGHVRILREALITSGNPVSSVVHIGIVPLLDETNYFQFKAATGTGRSVNETEFTVRVCLSSALQVGEGRCADVLSLKGSDIAMHNTKRKLP
jgi:hypothetical protein